MSEPMTSRQLEVVRWLVEHDFDREPMEAVRAGLVSRACIYSHWGKSNLVQWCAEYRATMPDPGMSTSDIDGRLTSMVPAALDTLASTLERGKGDRVAVDLARWIIGEARGKAPASRVPAPAEEDEQELGNLLRMTR